MYFESDLLWGWVLNLYNINFFVGGFIGGEVVFIVMKGLVMGIGSDIGGSICGFLVFCGIYGFKLILYMLFFDKMLFSFFFGEFNIFCVVGLMCCSIWDMDLFVKSVFVI